MGGVLIEIDVVPAQDFFEALVAARRLAQDLPLERAGMRTLNEGKKVQFDTQQDRRTGKIAVGNIQAA